LKENIIHSAKRKGLQIENIRRDGASFVCTISGKKDEVTKCLKYVFGIRQFLFAKTTSKELEKILTEVKCLYINKKMGQKPSVSKPNVLIKIFN